MLLSCCCPARSSRGSTESTLPTSLFPFTVQSHPTSSGCQRTGGEHRPPSPKTRVPSRSPPTNSFSSLCSHSLLLHSTTQRPPRTQHALSRQKENSIADMTRPKKEAKAKDNATITISLVSHRCHPSRISTSPSCCFVVVASAPHPAPASRRGSSRHDPTTASLLAVEVRESKADGSATGQLHEHARQCEYTQCSSLGLYCLILGPNGSHAHHHAIGRGGVGAPQFATRPKRAGRDASVFKTTRRRHEAWDSLSCAPCTVAESRWSSRGALRVPTKPLFMTNHERD